MINKMRNVCINGYTCNLVREILYTILVYEVTPTKNSRVLITTHYEEVRLKSN